jgi:hypothetical protein
MRYRLSHAARRPRLGAKVRNAMLIACMMTALATGCGKGANNGLIPVSGHVRLDGQPLPGASITFHSNTVQVPGLTDNDGRYELKPGAAAGEYRVVIGKMEGSEQAMLAVDPGAIGRVKPAAAPSGPPKQVVPVNYSDPIKTELRFTVASPGTTRADFDLVTKKQSMDGK